MSTKLVNFDLIENHSEFYETQLKDLLRTAVEQGLTPEVEERRQELWNYYRLHKTKINGSYRRRQSEAETLCCEIQFTDGDTLKLERLASVNVSDILININSGMHVIPIHAVKHLRRYHVKTTL